MKTLVTTLVSVLSLAAAAAEGFRLAESGLSTPRGEIAWNELVTVRLYSRPEQKFVEKTGLRATVRVLTETRAEIDLVEPDSKTFVPVVVKNAPDFLKVEIAAGDIVEPLGGCWRVMKLAVAPKLLAAEEGMYLLPLFDGAITPVRHSRALKSVDRIYSQQSEWEKYGLFNAFGLMTDAGSILGIVHGGEFRAWVETACTPGAASRQYAVLGIREDPGDMIEHETKSVYYAFRKDVKDYTGLALVFRDYLKNDRELTPLAVRAARNPKLEKVVSSLRFNLFLGMKNWPFKPDGSSAYFNATTFDEGGSILESARSNGLTNCWVTLVGWIKDGHDGAYPSHFPVNEYAGGEAKLRELLKKIRGWGWPVTPHDNIHSLYSASADFDSAYAARTRAGEMESMGLWSGGLCNIACPEIWIHRYGGDFERIHDIGFDGVYYIDAIATGLFRCHDPRHPSNEKAFALGQARVLNYARSLFGAAACETPAVYTLKYADYVAAGGSGAYAKFPNSITGDTRTLLDEGGRYVPFYTAARHGFVATQCAWIASYRGESKFLPLFVDGAVPAVEACMRAGSIGDKAWMSIETVKEPYRIYYELCPDLVKGLTVGFEEFAPNCVRYRYDNGYTVTVNATKAKVNDIPPLSLEIAKNGARVYACGY